MWHDNLLEIIKETGMSKQQIADRGNLPLKTVIRVVKGQTQCPSIDTLDRMATALGCTIGDILAGTKVVVGDENLAQLTTQLEATIAERDLVIAENAILKDKVSALSAENELLNMKLMHKEELLALHNYYNKLKHE
jgi:predicted transcriptional regulator